MKGSLLSRLATALLVVALAVAVFPSVSYADHSWGNYHWARTKNPFTLQLGENLSSDWEPYLATASKAWSKSKVLDTTIVPGATASTASCRPTLGKVEVCNAWSGNNGWLGLATIYISGDHIVQGTARMNDYYLSQSSPYNTSAWRNLVMCQEVAHTFGLDHQDEDFYNEPLGTCMDYSADPIPNQYPNKHDYEQLEIIYNHLDTTSTLAPLPEEINQIDFSSPDHWGQPQGKLVNGRSSVYVRDFGKGIKVVTFVFWVE